MKDKKKPRCAECGRVASHLLLPQHLDLCQVHYRLRRPYVIGQAAYAAFADLLTPAERVRWDELLAELEDDCGCQAPLLIVGGKEVSWTEYLAARRQARLAAAAGQVELMDPRQLAIARRSWPVLLHVCQP